MSFKFQFSKSAAIDYSSFLFAYLPSHLAWNARSLVNPLLVSRLLGLEAAGIVGLCLRLMEVANSGKLIVSRVANVLISQDRENLSMSLRKLLFCQKSLCFSIYGHSIWPRFDSIYPWK